MITYLPKITILNILIISYLLIWIKMLRIVTYFFRFQLECQHLNWFNFIGLKRDDLNINLKVSKYFSSLTNFKFDNSKGNHMIQLVFLHAYSFLLKTRIMILQVLYFYIILNSYNNKQEFWRRTHLIFSCKTNILNLIHLSNQTSRY